MPSLSEHCQIQGLNGEWGRVADYQGCCDCGLVHQMEYKLVDEHGVDVSELTNLRLMVRTFREEGLTSEARATRVFKYIPKEESK